MIDALRENRVRSDKCIGEVHISLFDLDNQRIKLEKNNGVTQVINLTGDPSLDAVSPLTGGTIIAQLLSNDLNYAELLYDLNGPGFEELARFSGERQLVFSIGGEEALASIGPNGTVRFENGLHLGSLDDTDLLSIRLYQANDAANVLWQYNLSGVYAYYKIPHVVRLLKKTDASPTDNKEFRILGGMRVRFEYSPEPDEGEILNYEWQFNPPGRFKKDFTFAAPELSNANTRTDTVYWEPKDWVNNHDVTGTLKISFNNRAGLRETRTKTFKVSSRVLEPKAAGSELEGTDVAMLEELLWQLGVSPGNSPGIVGQLLPVKEQRKFKTGNNSVGKMTGRFNYFSNTPINDVNAEQRIMPDGAVGSYSTIKELEKHWKHYSEALDRFDKKRFHLDDLPASDLLAAGEVFDGIINYPRGVSLANIDPTYTQDIHNDVRRYGDFEREDILKAMAMQESNGYQWGYRNKDEDNWRITVGGADEAGSSGFNQIQNKYVYGGLAADGINKTVSNCAAVSAYDSSGVSQVNHYDPGQNLVAKAVWLASAPGDCGRSFRSAFIGGTYTGTYNSNPNTVLLKINTGTVLEDVAGGVHDDDNYEKLAKGIGGYNQGEGVFRGEPSWLSLLSSASANRVAVDVAMRYAVKIMHDADKLGLPYRRYIFAGEVYPPGHAQAGQPVWCFAFGEREWIGGISWIDAKDSSEKYQLGIQKSGTIDYRVICP